jgi:hypothetical protein
VLSSADFQSGGFCARVLFIVGIRAERYFEVFLRLPVGLAGLIQYIDGFSFLAA